MAKAAPKTSNKKVNRKVKSSVRKTFAAVFMITAIIVATIPVPENLASAGDISTAALDPTEFVYDYPTFGASDDEAGTDGNINLTLTGDKYSWSISDHEGSKRMDWQFMFYEQKYNLVQYAVISKYNNTFLTETLNVPANAITGFVEVSVADFDDVLAANTEYKVISSTDTSGQGYNFISKYFPEEYADFIKRYEEYLEKLNEWNTTIPTPDVSTKPTEPAPLVKKLEDLSDVNKGIFVFNTLCKDYGTDCTLEIIDKLAPDTGLYSPIYVAKLGEKGNIENKPVIANEDTGFYLAKDKFPVLAIGNKVFYDTQNVYFLTMSKDIKFIGDSAFEKSFLKEVTLANVAKVGNRTFKACSQLRTVNMGNSLTSIGTEAFYGCAILRKAEFPVTLNRVGKGAFARCSALEKADFSAVTSADATIGKYAFFDCSGLNEVTFGEGENAGANFTKMEEGAFAIKDGGGSMEEFSYPAGISTAANLENYTLAGRIRLKNITMPASFGGNSPQKVPDGSFYNCVNLETVTFPYDSYANGFTTYDAKKLFGTVINPDFFIIGPKMNRNNEVAAPRSTTWTAETAVSNTVPYVYYENGVRYCEISDGKYLTSITEDGIINSVEPRPGENPVNIHFEVKDKYGGIDVTGLGNDCFAQSIRDELKSVSIYDDSIESIGNSVFANCPKLEEVTIGNSVNAIGNSAFSACPKLEKVTFHTPSAGYDNFTIGQDSFITGSTKLTFVADMMEGYAPFEWAMDPANYANTDTSVRVCYRSPEPYNMVAMLDNGTLLPTLVDYPRYDDIDTDNEMFIKGKDTSGYYLLSSRIGYFDSLYAAYDPADPERVAWEAYKPNYSIIGKYEDIYENGIAPTYQFHYLSEQEEQIVDATKHLVVPAGVDSIDIFGYWDSGKNTTGIAAYNLSGNADKWTAYTKESSKDDVIPGLFSGNYRDYTAGSTQADQYEKVVKGNDRVESITLNTVQKLPDYAFDSCERLAYVDLGQCTDIGLAPFRGCTSMNTVVGNDNLISYKGIIYEANGDGTYTILTCLGTRGNGVGEASISSRTDSPYIENVSRIEESAFEDCEYIGSVNFEDSKKLRTIPKYCFKNCDSLMNVILPDSVDTIQDEAFKGDNKINVTIPDIEVEIATSAFEHDTKSVTLYSYEDSAVERYAKQYNIGFEPLEGRFTVDFLDYDGTVLKERQYVKSGNAAAEPANPVRDGYDFTGWGASITNMKPSNITANVTFIAQYKAKNTGNNNNNNDDKDKDDDKTTSDNDKDDDKKVFTVTVINGSGSGSYTREETVTITANAPAAGKKFDRWETSSLNVSMANVKATKTTFKMPRNNVVVTAVYDSGNSGSGSSGSSSSSSSSSSTNRNPGSSTSGNAVSTSNRGQTTQNGTTVSISKPGISNTGLASAVVDGSTDNFIVKIMEDPQATAAVERALIAEYGSLDNIRYFPMDISLYDSTGTVKITDTSGLAVNITLPIPDDLITYAGNNKAGAVVGESTLEKLGVTFKTIDGVPCISFLATHFSPYTIYVNTNDLSAGMDSSPKTGDGIHPKWFLVMGLASLSVVLFMKKDKKTIKLA